MCLYISRRDAGPTYVVIVCHGCQCSQDFAVYLKKREQALDARNKAAAVKIEEDFRVELQTIQTKHDVEIKKLIDDAACL